MSTVSALTPPEFQANGRRAPLPFDEVDEMVTQFLQSHRMLWMTGPENKEFYSPTRMPAFAFQNSADAGGKDAEYGGSVNKIQ